MKKFMRNKYFLWFSLGCLTFLSYQSAHAQVDKAIKYAWYFDYEKAEKFLLDNENELNADMVVQLAEALYAQGKYPQALYYYKIADQKEAIKTQQIRRNYVHSSTMMREKSPYFKKTNYFKTNYFLYTSIDTFKGNSSNEDFAAFSWNNILFVTTSRRTGTNEKAFNYSLTKMPFLDVYPFNEQGKRIPFPVYLPKNLNSGPIHDGPITISKDTNIVVLTRNYAKADENGVQNLYLSYYLRNKNGKWSSPKTMEFCKSNFSAQHPAYNEAEQVVYFSSDMPGGYGGYDLYKTKWNGEEWSKPVNLGDEINTEFDEVFPSFSAEGELMYATNHIETTGGLDIVLFSNGNRFLLNEPFNSIYDDFGVNFKNNKEGYFSSNRFTNKFDDNIYRFNLSEPEKQSLFVKVFDAETGLELDNVKVGISNLQESFRNDLFTRAGRDNILLADTADARVPMKFMVSKDGYVGVFAQDNSYNLKEGKLVREFYLQIDPIFAANDIFVIEDNQSSSRITGMLANDQINGNSIKPGDVTVYLINNPLPNNISVDKEDGLIKLDAGITPGTYSFNYVIFNNKIPIQSDTANVTLNIRGMFNGKTLQLASLSAMQMPMVAGLQVSNDTGYATVNGGYVLNVRNNDRLNGKKSNFTNTVIKNIKTSDPNISVNNKTGAVTVKKGTPAGTYQVSYEMNQRGNKNKSGAATATIVVRRMDQIPGRGLKASKSKPIAFPVVYFNNDEPKQAQLFRPAFNYQNCFDNYLKNMESFYQNSVDSRTSLDTFFTYHVVGGYKEMNNVLAMLQQRLNQGAQIEISVSAYCSPIASEEYNNKLSTRRIVSITRFLKKWNDGSLNDAIESNRITFWEHAVGELESPKDVSEDYDKTNESVFGIKASRERRVSITVKIIEAAN
jgi:hypothetical protein